MMDHLELVEMAQRAGTAMGLPKPPAGLPDGGAYRLDRSPRKDGSKRATLRYEHDGVSTVLGWFVERPGGASTPAAPQANGTGPKPAPPRSPEPEPAGVVDQPEPMILLTPAAGGAWRLNGYGVEAPAVIRALRLALVHLVARQAGALIIDEVIAPEMAVVATERLPRLPQPRSDKRKAGSSGGRVKRTVSYDDLDDDAGDDAW